ncbi:MAG: hypothetical protein HKN32_00250, partial [Flavobacteriales bacterium]|nr:hypothetical protein [Flavobacteriales bacterium]
MKRRNHILRCTALVFLIIGSTLSTKAQNQTYYWVGGSSEWSNPQAWSSSPGGTPLGKVPGESTHVVISSSETNTESVILIDGYSHCNDLMISGPVGLDIANGSLLKVAGELKIT